MKRESPSRCGRCASCEGGGSSAGDWAAVGGSLAVVADDVSTSAEEIRTLPPPQPSPAALRCEGGGRMAGEAGAVGVLSMVMAGGSPSLFGEPEAPSSTERLPPPVGEGWGGVTRGTLVSVSSAVS